MPVPSVSTSCDVIDAAPRVTLQVVALNAPALSSVRPVTAVAVASVSPPAVDATSSAPALLAALLAAHGLVLVDHASPAELGRRFAPPGSYRTDFVARVVARVP